MQTDGKMVGTYTSGERKYTLYENATWCQAFFSSVYDVALEINGARLSNEVGISEKRINLNNGDIVRYTLL